MASLITIEEARLILGFDASQDDFYQFLIDSASAYIERVTKIKFPPTQVTEQLDGGFADLILKNRPIVSVIEVQDFGNPDNPVIVDPDLFTVYPEQGILRYIPRGHGIPYTDNLLPTAAKWARGARRWEVEYVAGFATGVPEEIKQASIMLVSYWSSASKSGGGAYDSETIGDYSYRLGSSVQSLGGIPPSVDNILRLFAEVSF